MQNIKTIQILILFFIGMILTIAGAVFKLMHWPLASLLLIIGMTFELIAILFHVLKLIKKDKKSDGFITAKGL